MLSRPVPGYPAFLKYPVSLQKTGDIGMASAACLYQSIVGCGIFCLANLAMKKYSPDDAII